MSSSILTSWSSKTFILDSLEKMFYYWTVRDGISSPTSHGWGTMWTVRTRRNGPGAVRILAHGSMRVPSTCIGLWCRVLSRATGVDAGTG
jgi:hypothetical protein